MLHAGRLAALLVLKLLTVTANETVQMGFGKACARSLLPLMQERLRARFPAGPPWEETPAGRGDKCMNKQEQLG